MDPQQAAFGSADMDEKTAASEPGHPAPAAAERAGAPRNPDEAPVEFESPAED